MTPRLDWDSPYRELDKGQEGAETKGPDFIEQDGNLFGWSESNLRYEYIGPYKEPSE